HLRRRARRRRDALLGPGPARPGRARGGGPPGAVAMSAAGALVCAGALAALVWAERTGRPRLRAVAKMTAAAGFLFAAIAGGALATGYGRWITAGLALGAAGDAALLGHGTRAVAA